MFKKTFVGTSKISPLVQMFLSCEGYPQVLEGCGGISHFLYQWRGGGKNHRQKNPHISHIIPAIKAAVIRECPIGLVSAEFPKPSRVRAEPSRAARSTDKEG
jgi:hypothetical protein